MQGAFPLHSIFSSQSSTQSRPKRSRVYPFSFTSSRQLSNRYGAIHNYFDDWILIKANSNCTKIEDIIIHKKKEIHVETYLW